MKINLIIATYSGMYGKFENNQLSSLFVEGNGEMIHYDRNGEQKLIGITKTASSNIFLL